MADEENVIELLNADPEQVVSVTVGELLDLHFWSWNRGSDDDCISEPIVHERICTNKAVEINRMTPIEFRTDNFVCSACHDTFFADRDGINHPIDWAFCPNCGARVVVPDDLSAR